jgi:hypothetical protein
MGTMVRERVKVSEEFCYSCERLLLTADEKLGPFCCECFKKTKRKDPLMKAAIRQVVVAVVPMICPHDRDRSHRCRMKFNVLVLDKKLEPKEITGPYTLQAAERRANRIRKQIDGRKP